jgi:integral membrane sensor domain MASE1
MRTVSCSLLLAPPRLWWVYLLASAAGNVVAHQQGWPISWVLMTEVVNLLRALLAAGGMRYFSDGPARFDSLQGVAAFLVFAVFLAPVTAAFAGACVVVLHGGEDFWLVWQAWLFSNALTGLTLLPIIVIGFTNARDWVKRLNLNRILEAGLLALGLLAVGIVVFASPYHGSSALPARLYAPLAFLLWAAVRFGPGGSGASLLVISTLAIWGAVHETGPFVTEPPAENLLSLQLFLLSISGPLMVLAALVEERKQTARALKTSYTQIRDLAGKLITAQENELLPQISVDQTTGNLAVAWYDGRNSPENFAVDVFTSVSLDGGLSFLPNVKVTTGPSDVVSNGPAGGFEGLNGLNDYGDYIGVSFFNNQYHVSWADNSMTLQGNPDNPGDPFVAPGLDIATATVSLTGAGFGTPNLPNDPFDPNDSFATAANLGVLTSFQTVQNLTINNQFGQDFFLYTAGRLGTLNLRIDYQSPTGGDLQLRVFTVNSQNNLIQIASSRLVGVTSQSITASIPGVEPLFVMVNGFNGAQATYNISASLF